MGGSELDMVGYSVGFVVGFILFTGLVGEASGDRR